MRPQLPEALLRLPVAHRALHDRSAQRPENSLPAIRAAVRAGYAIEIDLQPSADGEPMVFHDDTLERLTHATGPIRALGTAELQRVQVRDCREPIPTLKQVLAEVDGRVPLLIELKDQSGTLMGPINGALEQATAAALQGYEGPVAVMSFNPASVAHMARMAPAIARGITSYEYPQASFADLSPEAEAHRQALVAIEAFDAVEASFISHHWTDLSAPRVAELKAQGAAVLCWTIRSPGAEAEARRIADNITFEGYAA